MDKGKGISQDSVGQSKAPAVLWDVGIDFMTYPEFCSRDRAAALEASENAFWDGVLHEQTKSTGDSTDSEEGDAVLHGFKKAGPVGKDRADAVGGDDGSSSTSNIAVICKETGTKTTSDNMAAGVVIKAGLGLGNVNVVAMEEQGISEVPLW